MGTPQETDPPDVRLFVAATAKLLHHLSQKPDDQPLGEDHRLRVLALLAAARRLRDHLEATP